MALNNSTILENIWLQGTNDYQQRIPEPAIKGVAATADALMSPYNGDLYNYFISLMNMIATTYVISKRFENPLGEFKKSPFSMGKTVREIAVKYFKAHSFNPASETLLKLEAPEFESWYYTVNRTDQYTFSWTRKELAFAFESEYGLNDLMTGTMDALLSSDAYDEMRLMLELFHNSNTYWKTPIYNKHTDLVTDEATAKAFLQEVRALVYELGVTPSCRYNHIDVPVFAKPEELVLFLTPKARAVMDVQALAAAFNLEYAAAQTRIKTVPEDAFAISDTYAVLTTRDFFAVRDNFFGIEAAPYNPDNMSVKYYLQHWETVAASPLVPIIRFSTNDETTAPIVVQSTTGVTVTAESETVKAGGTVQLNVELEGTINPETEGISVKPDTVLWTIEGSGLNSRTYVDKYNVLHVQKSIESGTEITLTGTATYYNPGGETDNYSNTVTVKVE